MGFAALRVVGRKRNLQMSISAEMQCCQYANPGDEIMNEVEKEITTLEDELTHTEMRLDVGALDRVYADDIMVTAPIGLVVDKPAVMNEVRLAADKAKVESYDKNDLKVRAYGDNTAVTSYVIKAKATFEGTELNRQFCITNVWMKRDSGWQIVARHTATLEQPPRATNPN